MTAPFADIIEEDNTARVPAGNGIYGYIQVPTPIGPTDKVKLVDSETALLNWFTVNGKVEVGYDSGFFSALAYLKKSKSGSGSQDSWSGWGMKHWTLLPISSLPDMKAMMRRN